MIYGYHITDVSGRHYKNRETSEVLPPDQAVSEYLEAKEAHPERGYQLIAVIHPDQLKTTQATNRHHSPEVVGQKAKQDYLNNPTGCPKCKSEDLTFGHIEVISSHGDERVVRVNQRASCLACLFSWYDHYTLSNIEQAC